MIAPMLAGVVYFSVLSDFVRLLHDCNVKRVYFHSFWAGVSIDHYADCHCLAGLTSFANAFKLVVNGVTHLETDPEQITANRNIVGAQFRKLWSPEKGGRIRLIVGQVIDDRPPQSAWVPMDDFLAGKIPADFPVVRYTQGEKANK